MTCTMHGHEPWQRYIWVITWVMDTVYENTHRDRHPGNRRVRLFPQQLIIHYGGPAHAPLLPH